MRILSWNVAGLPSKINIIGNPVNRFPQMLEVITSLQADIICLQEVFCFKLLKKFTENLSKRGFYLHYSKSDSLISKNGLLTASKIPIKFTSEIDYSMYTGAEYLIKKGMLTSHLKSDIGNILVHNTHLQSNSIYTMNKICTEVRQQQKKEIVCEVKKNIYDLNLICGDLNDDFNTFEHQSFLKKLPFSHYTTNPDKIITFPKHKKQLDYIIFNQELDIAYQNIEVVNQKISDHEIIIADLPTWEIN